MKEVKHFFASLILLLLLSCSKDEISIDVSSIFGTDGSGTPIGSIGGSTTDQWKSQNFSDTEMRLFADLDTASLVNTSMPAEVLLYAAFPNPFRYYFTINAIANENYSGNLVVKYVIVNANMKPIVKNSKRLNSNLRFDIEGSFPSGKYRVYFTFSSQVNPHFYKSWGNIQKL